MAEFIFKDTVSKAGLQQEFFVSSSATSREEEGNPVYPPAKRELSSHGISCEGKRSVQIKASDYEKYDLFVCMDKNNARALNSVFKGDPQNKIRMLMDYTEKGGEVADPWYTDRFDIAYRDINMGCNGLLCALTKQK